MLAALAGDKPDRVPFVPNIWQWFYVNRERGTLPAALADDACTGPVDALRRMGADVMSKFDGLVLTPSYNQCHSTVEHEGEPFATGPVWQSFVGSQAAPIRRERIETPHGPLTQVWEYAPDAVAPFESEHWWKDFETEYAAVRCWMEDVDWHLDQDLFKAGLKNVGEDGLMLFQLLPTPLKKFHWLAGQANASLFMIDHFDAMRELAEIHEAKSLAALEEAIDLKNIWVFEVPDNLDSLFYSPPLFREFCLPVLQKAARMIHARGKYLFVHACGRLRQLADLLLESEIDCVEGQAHPPIGDWHLNEARNLSPQLIVCGGMTAVEQLWSAPDATARINNHVRQIMESMGTKRRFLYASGCGTSPDTPYENLLSFRNAAWKYGSIS
ncbi:MAG: hypothetical protein IT445_02250 [Phycisphaeraceae bacterium]|nr:hypothetical protein [Phycisphaeraceae bacterium]